MPMEHVFAVEALALAAGGSTSPVERLFFIRGSREEVTKPNPLVGL